MTNKVYRSANGKQVDLGALILKNEGVTAVGNMSAKARKENASNNSTEAPQKQNLSVNQPPRVSNVGNPEVCASNPAARKAREKRILLEKTAPKKSEEVKPELRSALQYLPEPVAPVVQEVLQVVEEVQQVVEEVAVSAVEDVAVPETVVYDEPEAVPQVVTEAVAPAPIVEQGSLTGLQAAIARAKALRENN